MNIYYVDLKLIRKDYFKKFDFLIDPNIRKRIETIKNYNRKQTSTMSYLIVKLLANMIYKIELNKLKIDYTENGKPYFTDLNNLFFNFSHSNNKLVIIFDCHECGIDIEKICKINFKIIEKFFSLNDKQYILSNNSDIKFTEVWSKREAAIKKKGFLTIFNKNVDISKTKSIKYNKYIIAINCESKIKKIKIIKINSDIIEKSEMNL